MVLSVTASGKVLTAFYSCLRLNRLLTSEPQTNIQGRSGVSIYISTILRDEVVHICFVSYKVCPFPSQSSNTDLRRRGRCRWSTGQRREAGGWRSRRGQRLVAQFLLLTSSRSCSTHTTWVLLYNHLCLCVGQIRKRFPLS